MKLIITTGTSYSIVAKKEKDCVSYILKQYTHSGKKIVAVNDIGIPNLFEVAMGNLVEVIENTRNWSGASSGDVI